MDVYKVFTKFDDEYLKFDRIASPPSNRPDLVAFLLLDKLMPGSRDIISAAEHDEFFIDCDVEELAKAATEDDIRMLVRCGVMYSKDFDCLSMYA